MRTLGGSVGLAAGVIVFNMQIRGSSVLQKALTASQLRTLYKSPLAVAQLPRREQEVVSTIYAEAFSLEMRTATYLAAACLVASVITWQRHPPFRAPPGPPKDKKVDAPEQEMAQKSDG